MKCGKCGRFMQLKDDSSLEEYGYNYEEPYYVCNNKKCLTTKQTENK